MAAAVTKLCRPLRPFSSVSVHFSSLSSSHQSLQHSIKAAIEADSYPQIADLLTSSNQTTHTPNPFSFLSTFPPHHRTKTIDRILQSFLPLRPRSRSRIAYSCLLSFTLQNPNPLPLALAILQRTIRSGCVPVPQTHLLLSNAWLHERNHSEFPVSRILLEMNSIGYQPDCGICNYLISSLCKVDQYEEAVQVLRGMGGAGCIPDLDSFGAVIGPLCVVRRTNVVEELMKEMVGKFRLTPRHETVVKVLKAMRGARKGVEMIKFLEEMGVQIGFESYELVVERCLELGEFVLAGKVVVGMTNRGLIPYIRVRQKVFEGLVDAGELELASTIRKKFIELNS